MSSKRRKIRDNPDRHAGILLNRESNYPVEISDRRGNSIFLNPLKRMIKNKPYVNTEYQEVANKMVRDAVQKNAAIQKQKELQKNEEGLSSNA